MRAVALIGLTVLVLAGCQFGGDSGKAEFIRQADGICARYERQISLIPQPQTFLRDFAVFMRRAVPIARRQNQALRRLKAPEDDDADFQRMLTARRAARHLGGSERAGVRGGRSAGAGDVQPVLRAWRRGAAHCR